MIKQIVLILCLAAFAASCSGPAPAPAIQPTVDASPTTAPTEAPTLELPTNTPEPVAAVIPTAAPTIPAAYGPTGFPSNVNPLTGLVVADPSLLERRPVAVKMQMYPRGQRPPFGVSQADIVYDYYNNFGMTRFHAIFYGQNAQAAGPVRSARLLDIDLVSMYGSIFVFGSAEQRTYSALFGQEFAPRLVLEGTVPCPPLCRVDPNGNNFLAADTGQLTAAVVAKGMENTRQPLEGMRFDTIIPPGGQAGMQATVRHSISAYTRWDFDTAGGRYLRSQDLQEAPDMAAEVYGPLVDGNNNVQISAENVVVIVVSHRYTFNSKPGPNEVIEIGLQGSGPAYAFRDGQVFQLTWNRIKRGDLLSLAFADGTPYPFKPGITWFEVVGKTTQLSTDGPTWRFNHAIP